jgi:SAM-dependent methyltransferase
VVARRTLPKAFLGRLRRLEAAYLESDDPIEQSGFHGGPEWWRVEREPILEAVDRGADFLDAGCANGYLLHCLVCWPAERGIRLTPYGVDIGPRLVELARRGNPSHAANFWVANAWDWRAPCRFRYVYTLADWVPQQMLRGYVARLPDGAVGSGGCLIVGAYGSRSRGEPPAPVARRLQSFGYRVADCATGGDPPVSAFAGEDNQGGRA